MLKRLMSLVLTIVAIAAVVVIPTTFKLPAFIVGSPVAGQLQQVKAKDLTLVCPGPAVQSSSSSKVGSFSTIGSAAVDYASQLPAGVKLKTLKLTGAAANSAALANSGGSLGNFATSSAVSITATDPQGLAQQNSKLLSAANYQVASAAGINGAIGANCQRPAAEQWLLGASTAIGREALLIVANPNATDATVNLQLFGGNGLIDGAGLNGIAVPANRTTILPLAGFAPDNQLLAVKVVAQGASVASWVQQKTVRGTLAGGADLISPAADAAASLVLPGLFKRGTADATALIKGNADYQDLTPSLAVFVPGSQAATVTVQVIGTDSKTFGTVLQQSVEAGQTMDLPITGLKDGDYSVFVTSSQPVIAAARLSRTLTAHATAGQNSTTDFAWLNAVPAGVTARRFVVPNSGISKLSVATTEAGAARVTITGNGPTQSLEIAKLSSKSVSLTAGSVVTISSDVPVVATMIVDFNAMIVAIPVVDFQNQGGSIRISVR
ncbi:MAG: hypothetical protein RL508_640 [Actinomycetota bacterium]